MNESTNHNYNINLTPLREALQSLENALAPPPQNDRERDGAIQRFEYTFELMWKAGKRVLAYYGITSNSPRSVIRDLAQQGWIHDADQWLDFLESRNATSHTYSQTTAEEVYESAKSFLPECQKLLKLFEQKLNNESVSN